MIINCPLLASRSWCLTVYLASTWSQIHLQIPNSGHQRWPKLSQAHLGWKQRSGGQWRRRPQQRVLVARAARINALLRFWELGEEGSRWGFGEPLWEEGLHLSGVDRGLRGRGEAPTASGALRLHCWEGFWGQIPVSAAWCFGMRERGTDGLYFRAEG